MGFRSFSLFRTAHRWDNLLKCINAPCTEWPKPSWYNVLGSIPAGYDHPVFFFQSCSWVTPTECCAVTFSLGPCRLFLASFSLPYPDLSHRSLKATNKFHSKTSLSAFLLSWRFGQFKLCNWSVQVSQWANQNHWIYYVVFNTSKYWWETEKHLLVIQKKKRVKMFQ